MLTEYKKTVNSIWLFPSPVKKEDVPRDPSACRKALARILKRAECEHVPFHAMRHTFASNAFHYGMDVKTLASTIGHESVETTLNVYAHSSEQMKRDAAKKIDEAIGTVLGADVTASDASCGDENGEAQEPTNDADKPKTVEFKPYQPKYRKLLSKEFDVSINTLLGSPRKLVCQCCGMPLEDSNISKEIDGFFNEEYCKWCYADGEYTYDNMDDLIDFCADHMANEHFTPEQVRAYMKDMLPKLNYWKKYTELGGEEKFDEFKKQLMKEFNDLHIEGMPEVTELSALIGGYVNLEYTLPNGQKVKYLDDGATYLGYQLESEFGGGRCFGLVANMDFLLVCTYEENGENPELVIYKKR